MTIVTTISGLRGNKFWVYRDVEIGKPHKGLVTRYKIVNGKLFAWRDSTGIVTKSLLKVLSNYNALDSSMITDPYCVLPSYTIDELAKAASYYFSKQNIKIFKVQETSVAPLIGLRQPKLDYGNGMKRNPKIDSIYYGWRNYVKSLKREDKQ